MRTRSTQLILLGSGRLVAAVAAETNGFRAGGWMNGARVAEASGLDGVFAYDHLFRRNAAGERRPAIEMFALMGAVAGATKRIAVGSLVARARRWG